MQDGQKKVFNFKDEAGLAVQQLLRDYQSGRAIDRIASAREPDRDVIVRMIDELFQIVYPGYYRDPNMRQRVFNMDAAISTVTDDILISLSEQIEIALRYTEDYHEKSAEHVREESQKIAVEFVRRIPRVREYLDTDVQAMLDVLGIYDEIGVTALFADMASCTQSPLWHAEGSEWQEVM